jgi:hypothetical protein
VAHANGWLAVTIAPCCFAPSSSCSHFLRRRARCCPAHERHGVARDAGHRVRPHATRRHLHHTARQVDARRRSAYRKQVRQLKAALRSAPLDTRVAAEPFLQAQQPPRARALYRLLQQPRLARATRCGRHHRHDPGCCPQVFAHAPRPRCRAVVLQQGNAPPPVDKAGLAPAGQ